MIEKIKNLQTEIKKFKANNAAALAMFRRQFIAKKGVITALFSDLKTRPLEEKKTIGPLLNNLKNTAQKKFKALAAQLNSANAASVPAFEDLTLPPISDTLGALHPLTIIQTRIIELLEHLGFCLAEGPEIEDDWHNFTALNFPKNHPARAMVDTFFISKNPAISLRTHTSSVQVRIMENQPPPIRTISLGRVFRNETISARAHCIFHQVEALYIDQYVSFVDLKATLSHFVRALFGEATKMRFRASYFPFTEPSAEIDIDCRICQGKGCKVCKYTGWVEIGGAGMVDPNVLKNCKIDAQAYTGFAFGMGIERIAMLQYKINDIRLFIENDLRFLKQFVALH